LTNEVSGVLDLGAIWNGEIVNYGVVNGLQSVSDDRAESARARVTNFGTINVPLTSDDRVRYPLVNHGTMTFAESADYTVPHDSGLPGEFVFAESVENDGTLILHSKRIRSNRFLFEGALHNAGELRLMNCGLAVKSHVSIDGRLHARSSGGASHSSDVLRFHGSLRILGNVDISGADVIIDGSVTNGGRLTVGGGADVAMNGGVANSGAFDVTNAQQLRVRGELHNSGVMNIQGTPVVVDAGVVNRGKLTVGGNTALAAAPLVFSDNKPGVTLQFSGEIHNHGTMEMEAANVMINGSTTSNDAFLSVRSQYLNVRSEIRNTASHRLQRRCHGW
jgi:hypothetical protein